MDLAISNKSVKDEESDRDQGKERAEEQTQCSTGTHKQHDEKSPDKVSLRTIQNKHNEPLDKLQSCLIDNYLQYTALDTVFDKPKELMKSYINLALITEKEQKEKEQRCKKIESTFDDKRLPSHEEIFAVKEIIKLNKLFDTEKDKPEPKKLLILGRAGIGKTILCQYFAVRWALTKRSTNISVTSSPYPTEEVMSLPWLEKFEVVVWLKLREVESLVRIQQNFQLTDVIINRCLNGFSDKKPSAESRALSSSFAHP